MDAPDDNDPTRPPARRRLPGRQALRTALWTAAILLLGLGTLIAFWRPVLLGVADLALRTQGLGPFDARIVDLDWDRLVLEDVALGPGASVGAGRATIGFSLRDLALLDIELIRPRVDGRLVDGRLDIPAFAPLLADPGNEENASGPVLPSLPFRSLRIEDFELRLALGEDDGAARATGDARLTTGTDGFDLTLDAAIHMPAGRAEVSVDGAVTGRDGTLALDGRATLADLDMAGATGSARATVALRRGPDGTGTARITLADGRFAHGSNTVEDLSGTVEAEMAADGTVAVTADVGFRSGGVGLVALTDGRIAGTWRDGRLDAVLDLPWRGGRLRVDVAYPADESEHPLRIAGEGGIDTAWLASLAANDAMTASGRLDVAGTLHTRPPEVLAAADSLSDWLDAARGEVTVAAAALDVAVPDVLRTGPIAGRAVFGIEAGTLSLTLPGGLSTPAAGLAPALHGSLPAALAAVLATPVGFTLSAENERPAATLAVDSGGGYRLTLAPRLALSAARSGSQATLEANGDLTLDAGFGLGTYRVETLNLAFDRLPVGGLITNGRIAARDVAGGAGHLSAAMDLTVRADGRPHASIEIAGALLTTAGRIDWRDAAVTFLPATGRIGIGSVRGKVVDVAGGATLDLDRQRTEPIRFDLATGTLETDITVAAAPFRLAMLAADPPVDVDLRLGRVRLSGAGGATRLRVSGGSFQVPVHDIQGQGLGADVALLPGGDHTGRIELAVLRHAVPVPWFIPLSLDLNSRGAGDRITFDGRLADSGARFAFEMRGEHRLSSGRGHADLAMPEILFLPTVLHPRQLFPIIEASIRDFDGTIGMHGRFTWSPDGTHSAGGLDVAVRQASSGEIVLENAAMAFEFDNLAPPSTPPGQSLTFDRLVASLPFTNGVIDLQVMPEGRVVAEIVRLDLFGGRITTDAVILDPGATETAVTLSVEDIDLERLMAFTEFGELAATGKLRGELPVVLRRGGMTIRGGTLGTAVPGHLRYVPKGVGPALEDANEATDVLMQVVRDFDYESIEVGIDEDEAGEMKITMRIDGKSPKVYGGLPVVLNIDISGPLQKIIADALRPYQLPSDIQERIQGQPPR